MRKFAILVILTLIFLTGAVRGQEVEYVSSTLFSGTLRSCEISNGFAFCAGNHSLQVFSIDDPDNPSFVSGHRFLSDLDRVFYHEDVIYAVGDTTDIYIVDAGDPSSLIGLGSIDIECPTWISFEENYAYIATCSSGVFIYDISYPSNPVLEGQHFEEGNGLSWIYKRNDLLYLCHDNQLIIMDISSWENPQMLGSYVAQERITDIEIDGNYCYLIWFEYQSGTAWEIIDISDPTEPTVSARILDNTIYDFSVLDDFAYILGNSMRIYDISDRSLPLFTGELPVIEFWVEADSEYVYAGGISFQTIDISNPYYPTRRGNYHLPGWIHDVFVVDDYAYTANSLYDVYVTDISDPENAIQVGRHERFGVYSDVYVVYPYAYYLCRPMTLVIFDISNPYDPVLLSEQFYNGDPGDIVVKDQLAYIAGGHGMIIMDVSDPEDPFIVTSYYGNLTNCLEIDLVDNYAYIVDDWFVDGNLKVINIEDPENPFLQGSVDFRATDIVIQGDYGFASGIEPSMIILDITDSGDPVIIGSYDQLDTAEAVFVSGDLAYLISGNSIQLVDISDPWNPVGMGYYSHLADPSQLFVKEGYIFVADKYSLEILRLVQTAVNDGDNEIPSAFSLSPNYPNPFNAATTIRYDLPTQSEVVIEIYDLLGRKIETLATELQPAGSHSIVWDAEDVSSGVYFYRIEAGDYEETHKCVLLK